MMLIGAGAATIGSTYSLGTLTRMGPGFLPCVLGAALVLVGVAIAVAPAAPALGPGELGMKDHATDPPDWTGWLAVATGPFLFIVLAHWGGLVPASFACVFASALGDRTATWRGALLLALAVTVFGAVLFGLVLQVPLPLFHGV